ncbi:TPA: hypothetical protein RQK91_002757 [Vibrio vulnificus]|nr:hypothetical protein [Vibrio vulnificus]
MYPSTTPWRHVFTWLVAPLFFTLPVEGLASTGDLSAALTGEYATRGGEATYSIELSIAKGRADFQPTLSLDYQSDSPNGVMGMGWSLGGTSSIYRCGQNLRIDGRMGGIHFDANDRFCLDGQRLIAVKGQDGQSQTEYRVEKNGYDKVVAFGFSEGEGPSYFKVWRTDGTIHQYGGSDDARVELPGQTNVYKWARNEISDVSRNNLIQYVYEEDTASGQHHLKQIAYVGGQVTFDYESRPDKAYQFLHGSQLQRAQRLTHIQVRDAQGSQVGQYQLDYQMSPISSRSLLSQVQYCAANGQCTTPITFDWYASSETDVFQRDKTKIDFEHVRYFDANRDGHKAPYGVKSKAETLTWCTESITNGFRGLMRDLSGKETAPGMPGFALQGSLDAPLLLPRPFEIKNGGQCGPKGRGSWYEYHYDDELPAAHSYQPALDGVLVDYSKQSKTQVAGDFNGDGKQTLIGKPYKYGKPLATQVLDIDNDGIDDYTYINDYYRYFHLSSNHHQAFRIPDDPYVMSLFADINHDGYLDWIRVSEGFNVLYMKYRLFNGKSFEPERSSPALPRKNSHDPIVQSGMEKIYFVDLNSDGYPELYVNGHIFLNEAGTLNFDKRVGPILPDVDLVDDINGDGLADFITRQYVSGYLSHDILYRHLSTPYPVDKLARITEQAIDYEIQYLPAADETVHKQQRYFEYPIINTTPPRYLVSKVTKSPKGYAPTEVSFRYEGGKSHVLGGGWLGFANITEVESAEVLTTRVTEFHQLDLKLAGEPKWTKIYRQPQGHVPFEYQKSDLLSETTYDYQIEGAEHVYQVYTKSTNTLTSDKGVPLKREVKTQKVDAVGNVIQERVVVSNPVNFLDYSSTQRDNTYLASQPGAIEDNNAYWKLSALTQMKTLVFKSGTGLSKETTLDHSYTETGWLSSVIQSGKGYGSDSSSALTLRYDYEYDRFGNVLSQTQSGTELPARKTTYQYDGLGLRRLASLNPKGHRTSLSYDAFGHLLSTVSPLKGRTTSYEYDGHHRVTKETRPGQGNHTTMSYQLGANCMAALPTTAHCVTTANADGTQTLTHYDYADREIRQLHRAFDGQWVTVDTTWDRNGRKRSVSRPHYLSQTSGVPTVTFEYDLLDREVRKIEPTNRGTFAEFKTAYTVDQVITTDARGFQRTATYNIAGQLIRLDEPLGAYQTYQYFPDGKLHRTTDSQGNVTTIQYDNLGYRSQLDDPDLGQWTYRYNAAGELIYKQDANGMVTTLAYDTLGRKTQQVENGEISTWRYDENGALGTLSGFSGYGQQTDYYYNESGLLQEQAMTVKGDLFSIQYEYDAYERVAREIRPDGRPLSDALAQPTHDRLAIESLYNPYGYLSALRSPRTYSNDVFTSAQFRREIRPLLDEGIAKANDYLQKAQALEREWRRYEQQIQALRATEYTMDDEAVGQLTAKRYQQWCDEQGQCYLRPLDWVIVPSVVNVPLPVVREEGPIYQVQEKTKGSRLYTLTPVSRAAFQALTLTQGAELLPVYDGEKTVKLVGHASRDLTAIEALTQSANQAKHQAKGYIDQAEQLITQLESVAKLSRLSCQEEWATHRDQEATCHTPRQVQLTKPVNATLTRAELDAARNDEAYVYYWQRQNTDAYDHTQSEILGNGLVNRYEYDANTGRPNTIQTQGAHPLRYLEYQYDAHNNVTRRFDEQLGITDQWEYDALDRVTNNTIALTLVDQHGANNTALKGPKRYEYDTLGNLTYQTDIGAYQYGQQAGPHAVTQAKGLTYHYDKVGNVLNAVKGAETERQLTWSAFNKPTQITRNGQTVTFAYDANHQRYQKTTSDGTQTVYMGSAYERVTDTENGTIQHKHYVYAQGKLIALATQTTDALHQLKDQQVRYLHYDALDSIDLITDGYGLVVERRSYSTWGQQRPVLWRSNSVDEILQEAITHRGYTGHEEIPEVGFIHMNGRVYDPELARFTSADPVIQDPYAVNSFNRYAYVHNNPLKYTDPTGFTAQEVSGTKEDSRTSVNHESGNGGNGRKDDPKDPKGEKERQNTPATSPGMTEEFDPTVPEPGLINTTDAIINLIWGVDDLVNAANSLDANSNWLDNGVEFAVGVIAAKSKRLKMAGEAVTDTVRKLDKLGDTVPSGVTKGNVVDPKRTKHIFREKEGHLPDTPENRRLLEGVADDPKAILGNDKFGNTWSAQTLPDGSQVWTQSRNGQIINGGVNQTPRSFNSETGLSALEKPRQK